MTRAVTLARRGLGTVAPNPVVGAVVLDRAGRQVGEGRHRKAGGPHAEVHALRAAGSLAEGGTAVVTHIRGLDVPSCGVAPSFRILGTRRLGDDVRTVLEPVSARGK